METPALEEIPLLGISLETFLGGMETDFAGRDVGFRFLLETFLGGMETQHLGERLLLVRRDLETFLGGMETVYCASCMIPGASP